MANPRPVLKTYDDTYGPGWTHDAHGPMNGRRLRCTACGWIGAESRPNWNEMAAQRLVR
jgi:hypothetical protein